MIRLRVSGGNFDPIVRMIDRLSHPDLTPLAQDIRGIMIRDNREGLLASTDANGNRMDDLSENTIKRGRGGDGPPLVPTDTSRAISDYDVEIEPAPDRTLLIGGWRNTPWMHFHATGAPNHNMPQRNPVGIRPEGQERIASAMHDFAASLIGGQP